MEEQLSGLKNYKNEKYNLKKIIKNEVYIR